MRYADVLLMYAEASIVGIEGNVPDGANAGDAQAQFDKIRTRAGLAPVALNMDNLMKERAFELCGEYVRKFDLMRWGKLKEALTTTMERIANLNAHTGEFAETSDYMWFKYKKNDDLLYQGTGARAVHAYEMETIYGLAKGENARPAEFDENAHWVEKNIMANDDGTRHLADYQLYRDADKIDSRHYWPIFLVNVSASDGELWNDYGY